MISSQYLKNTSLFSRVPEHILDSVIAGLQPRQMSQGELLFSLGDPGDELFIVESGKIALFTPQKGKPLQGQPFRIFQAGEILGEMALIDHKPRSASARAEESATLYVLGGDTFRRLIRESDEMALSVMAGLNERIRYTTNFLSQVSEWVQQFANGNYQTAEIIASSSQYQDKMLATLAAAFAEMASRVQEREDKLRQEVAMLRIEIDEAKRKRDVAELRATLDFDALKEKARRMRQGGA